MSKKRIDSEFIRIFFFSSSFWIPNYKVYPLQHTFTILAIEKTLLLESISCICYCRNL